jgi:hypothetical protein
MLLAMFKSSPSWHIIKLSSHLPPHSLIKQFGPTMLLSTSSTTLHPSSRLSTSPSTMIKIKWQYLLTLLARLIQCERKLTSNEVMIRGEISNHAMFVNHQPSRQAEGTLKCHDPSSPATSPWKFEPECWGCGAKGFNAHVYCDKATGKILCPRAHKPEISHFIY